jgi:hypothetical protein
VRENLHSVSESAFEAVIRGDVLRSSTSSEQLILGTVFVEAYSSSWDSLIDPRLPDVRLVSEDLPSAWPFPMFTVFYSTSEEVSGLLQGHPERPDATTYTAQQDLEWFFADPERVRRHTGGYVAVSQGTIVGEGTAESAYRQAREAGIDTPLLVDLRHLESDDDLFLGL